MAKPVSLPEARTGTLEELREEAAGCTACPLYKNATQTVFGEGPKDARVILVGEQPGDQEDLTGKPFVGPAGKMLDRAMEEAGIDRRTVYITNAVKHFKWMPRGKRRLHEKPNAREIHACNPWLTGEFSAIRPVVVVCLGATAAQAVMGSSAKVMRDRGKLLKSAFAQHTILTVHPSSLLRAPDPESRELNYKLFVADLRVVARVLGKADAV